MTGWVIITVGKEDFISVTGSGRERAFMERNSTTTWPASGSFMFDLAELSGRCLSNNYNGNGLDRCILLKYHKKYFDVHHLELRPRLFELKIMGCRKASVSTRHLILGLGDTRSAISSLDISLGPVSPCPIQPVVQFPFFDSTPLPQRCESYPGCVGFGI